MVIFSIGQRADLIPFLYDNLMKSGTMLETAKSEFYNIETCVAQWSAYKMLQNSKEIFDKCGKYKKFYSVKAVKRYGTIKPQLPIEPI